MLTAGDIEFEPSTTKMYRFNPYIVALQAGDSASQIAICNATLEEIQQSGINDVGIAAEIYGRKFAEYRRNLARIKYLAPIGLDFETYYSRQQDMTDEQLARLERLMQAASDVVTPGVDGVDAETIIAGVDGKGAHIYLVYDPGYVVCYDTVGFVSIGYGKGHANSQFMFAGHTRWASFTNTILLTYAAKKRAEVAPGVGTATDMFGIGFGGFVNLDSMLGNLDAAYKTARTAETAVWDNAYKSMDEQFKSAADQAAAQPSPPLSNPPSPPQQP